MVIGWFIKLRGSQIRSRRSCGRHCWGDPKSHKTFIETNRFLSWNHGRQEQSSKREKANSNTPTTSSHEQPEFSTYCWWSYTGYSLPSTAESRSGDAECSSEIASMHASNSKNTPAHSTSRVIKDTMWKGKRLNFHQRFRQRTFDPNTFKIERKRLFKLVLVGTLAASLIVCTVSAQIRFYKLISREWLGYSLLYS